MELQDATIGDIAERLHELLSSDRTHAGGDELLRRAHDWEAAGRATDAARIWVAAEIENESRRELDTSGLAYRHGFASAKKLIATTANVSERTAGSRMALGRQLRSSLSITGLPVSSNFPAVESALHDGRIGVDAAAIICRTLSEVLPRTRWSEAVDEAERHLVHAATATIGDAETVLRYTVDELGRLATRIREHLDPDGAEPRDAVKQALRGFSHPKVGADGMARGKYALPPLQLGVFLTAVDSILSPRTADPEGSSPTSDESRSDEDTPGYAPPDLRTSEQKLLDAVMTLIEMAAASPTASRLNGAAPTVNVHVSLNDLAAGRGVGWIDGSSEPVPVSTVNMLQCDADTIVTLFGSDGQVLNHSKTQRLATRAQRRALAARDGGCVIPGCTVPPSRCQAHHVIPWVSVTFAAGRTDIDNLALLCPFHHATIHTSAWTLEMIRGKPHVRPPDWHDPKRTPIPAGQQRAGRPYFR
ncbi:HNH endonuclease [Agreia bicolorata]|uniref:HNH endonuclease n=1 Tax=Agreia bicolorata TaxID=110935 RepID=A0A1T4XYL5_9MICO|nr:HNH endonuclease signature motif containing protein [Agreia bicolorata]SKA94145.1 HNH endonuclease [Agreia bicolorata]